VPDNDDDDDLFAEEACVPTAGKVAISFFTLCVFKFESFLCFLLLCFLFVFV
jgi:hypothetical protein